MPIQGPLSNQKLGEKYLLGELLGRGGCGEVYKAQNLSSPDRLQAIKVLREELFYDPRFRERFKREARILAGLRHPNIVPFDDSVIEEDKDRAYFVMPFIGGGTFASTLKQSGQLSLEGAAPYLKQICDALAYAHARNVVHLDLKPLNLLYQGGKLLLSDFGLARLMKDGIVQGGSSLSFGTPHYMAPEQIQGHPEPRSDIYAVGVILYQMLTGRLPFSGGPETVIFKAVTEPYPPLRASRPDLPEPLEAIIAKALAKKPEERYKTAGDLWEDFRVVLLSPRPPPVIPGTGEGKQNGPIGGPTPPGPIGGEGQSVPDPRGKREKFIERVYRAKGSAVWLFALSLLSGLGSIVSMLARSQEWALGSVVVVALLAYLLGYRKAIPLFTMIVVVAIACAATFGLVQYESMLSSYTQPQISQFWLIGARHLWLGRQIDWGIGIGAFWAFGLYRSALSDLEKKGEGIGYLFAGSLIGAIFVGLVTWLILALLAAFFGWGFGFGFGWGEGLIALGIGIVGGMGLADALHICWKALTIKQRFQ